jgi:hypothetical protein
LKLIDSPSFLLLNFIGCAVAKNEGQYELLLIQETDIKTSNAAASRFRQKPARYSQLMLGYVFGNMTCNFFCGILPIGALVIKIYHLHLPFFILKL